MGVRAAECFVVCGLPASPVTVDGVAGFVGALPDKAVTYVSADAATADLSAVFKGADAVVSCVGVVPGGKNQLAGNGAVNVAIADAAAKSKVPKMVRREPPTPPRPTPPRRST